MNDLVASGRVVDLIFVVMAFEATLLMLRRASTGRGIEAQALLYGLAPGACLLLALRAALTGASWGPISACLIAAGVLHVCDLAYRHRTSIRPRSIAPETVDPSRA